MNNKYLILFVCSTLLVIAFSGYLIEAFQVKRADVVNYNPNILYKRLEDYKQYNHSEADVAFLEKLVETIVAENDLNAQNQRVFNVVLPYFTVVFLAGIFQFFLLLIIVIAKMRRKKEK